MSSKQSGEECLSKTEEAVVVDEGMCWEEGRVV